MSNVDFSAQKMEAKVLSKAEVVGIITPAERARRRALIDHNKTSLTVLKRPKINRNMTKTEINEAEHEAYLNWRRELAKLEQLDGVVITPYERNLEFWRQLWQVIERSDVLVQLVDARQPLLFYSSSLDDYIKSVDSHKQTLILINKSDLLTTPQRKVWAEYFDSINVRVLFFSALQAQEEQGDSDQLTKEVSEEQQNVVNQEAPLEVAGNDDGEVKKENPNDLTPAEMCRDFDEASETSSSDSSTLCDEDDEEGEEDVDAESEKQNASEHPEHNPADVQPPEEQCATSLTIKNSSELLSVNALISELVRTGTKPPDSAFLTVGFLGYPNVGKSSTLNALCGAKKVSVSATPGKTKHYQTICLQSNLQLCDCPGMVMPSFAFAQEDLVVAGILPIDEMRDCLPPVRLICEQIPREVLSAIYGISIKPPKEHEDHNRPPTPHELLAAYACMRGFMSTKGNPHYDRAARIILKDYVNGRLRYCHPPPGTPAADYQVMGILERNLQLQVDNVSTAELPVHLAAYVAPSDVHKLAQRKKRTTTSAASGDSLGGETCVVEDEEGDSVLTEFDRMALASQNPDSEVRQTGSRQLYRSKKKLAFAEGCRAGDGDYDNDDDDGTSSTSSWSTVGGASLLSGVSCASSALSMSSTGTTNNIKKPWRQMSASKKANRDTAGGGRKRKEKLRRVYVDLDRHAVE